MIEQNNDITGVNFVITSSKLYVPVLKISINDKIKFLENIKQGFKRTTSWNIYRSEITTQPRSNNLDYLIHPTFRNINRLFVLLFMVIMILREILLTNITCHLVGIKDFNALIDNKSFFHQPVKTKQTAYEKIIEMSRSDECTTGNLLDFSYHQNYYKLIGMDSSRQTNMNILQQINFREKVEEDDGATMFFITEKQQKTILNTI